jgi:DNA-binding transcriptional MerR regulator
MNKSTENQYSIRQVVELTGVTEFVLRAWELRYGAFKPKRTLTGRRIYAKEDILKARTLFELTRQHYKIGDIAKLSSEQLKEILGRPEKSLPKPNCEIIYAALNFAQLFKWEEVREIFLERRVALGLKKYIFHFILPFLQILNEQILENKISIAQEHILSAFIKESLHSLSSKPVKKKISKRLVLASIEGDFHEIGLLIGLVLSKHAGLQTLYLGANVPKRDLCETCIRFRATHILLTSTVSKGEGAKEDFLDYLNFMDQHLPKKTEFWLGGRNALQNSFSLNRKNSMLSSFTDLQEKLDHLSK